MNDAERCTVLDAKGCRCEMKAGHGGLCSPSYTPWKDVLKARSDRRLVAIRDGALKAGGQ